MRQFSEKAIEYARRIIQTYFKNSKTGLPYEPTEGQCEIFLAIISTDLKRVWITTTTQYGKSEIVAMALLWLARNRSLKIPIVAPTKDKAEIIMGYVTTHLFDDPYFTEGLMDVESLQRLKTERSRNRLAWSHGSEIKVTSADSTSRGKQGISQMGTAGDILVEDEASHITDKANNKTIRMLGGNLAVSKIVKVSNTFEKNHFYKSSISPRYFKIKITWEQAVAEGRLTKEFVEEMREEMDAEDFGIMYECEFPSSGAKQVIGADLIRKCVKLFTIDKGGKYVLGIDVARKGKDDTVFVIARRKGDQFEIVKVIVEHGLLGNEVIGQARKLIKEFKVTTVGVDVIGVGAGVADGLRDAGYNVVDFVASAKAEHDKSYHNKKAETIYKFKRSMADGTVSITDEVRTRKELESYEKTYDALGRYAVKDSEDSPDVADAIIIAFSLDPQPDEFLMMEA